MASDPGAPQKVCDHCRGALLWDGPAQALRCQSCGAACPIQQDGAIPDHDLEQALAQGKLRSRAGTGARLIRCGECQAEVELPDEVQATRCEFCASPLVFIEDARDDHYRPESVVPFSFDRGSAAGAFQGWLGRLWLRPADLRRTASLHELHGVYIPYWAFCCAVTSRWSADAGYTYWEEEYTTDGAGRRVQRTRWQPCTGQRHDQYEDHLVCASRGLAAELVGPAQRFRTAGLLPYAPEYLLGFSAERYAVDLRQGWRRARHSIGAHQEARCQSDVPGDTQRRLRATHQFQAVRFKHVLLPLWVAAYRYRGQVYRLLVNGQTGQVSGAAPYSAGKIALLATTALLALGVLLYFLHLRPHW